MGDPPPRSLQCTTRRVGRSDRPGRPGLGPRIRGPADPGPASPSVGPGPSHERHVPPERPHPCDVQAPPPQVLQPPLRLRGQRLHRGGDPPPADAALAGPVRPLFLGRGLVPRQPCVHPPLGHHLADPARRCRVQRPGVPHPRAVLQRHFLALGIHQPRPTNHRPAAAQHHAPRRRPVSRAEPGAYAASSVIVKRNAPWKG